MAAYVFPTACLLLYALGNSLRVHIRFLRPFASLTINGNRLLKRTEPCIITSGASAGKVTDIADAVILRQIFQALFKTGVAVVATFNRAPGDLYKNGLQRDTFLPFIDGLKEYCHTICLNSGLGYRRLRRTGTGKLLPLLVQRCSPCWAGK
ncbi:AFG1-like ATPase [Syngnathus typhle]